MVRFIIAVVLISILSFYFFLVINNNLKTELNEVTIEVFSEGKDKINIPTSLRIAVIGDTHTKDNLKNYEKLNKILLEVKEQKPDFLFFLGDYTAYPTSVSNMKSHRNKLIKLMTQHNILKTIFVMGNYETWSNPNQWLEQFKLNHALILENEVRIIRNKMTQICIRGLGDYYTKRFEYVEFPKECNNLPKITITHDPAGAFHPNSRGFFISGHTHCGQIRFPFLGPLWVPTEAPKEAYCGLYQDNKRVVFTTSGVGTTILPVRFRTQSNWDLLTVNFQ